MSFFTSTPTASEHIVAPAAAKIVCALFKKGDNLILAAFRQEAMGLAPHGFVPVCSLSGRKAQRALAWASAEIVLKDTSGKKRVAPRLAQVWPSGKDAASHLAAHLDVEDHLDVMPGGLASTIKAGFNPAALEELPDSFNGLEEKFSFSTKAKVGGF